MSGKSLSKKMCTNSKLGYKLKNKQFLSYLEEVDENFDDIEVTRKFGWKVKIMNFLLIDKFLGWAFNSYADFIWKLVIIL